MPISAQFTADFSQFTAAAGTARDALGEVTTAADQIAIEQQAHDATMAIGNLAGEIKDFATEFISAYAEEEAATERLRNALTNQGIAADETVDAYARMGEAFQKNTRFADDAVTAAQTLFTTIGEVGPEQMEPAIQAAADLAASLQISLPAAAKLMATAMESGGTKLGQLNKYFGDTELKGLSAAETIEVFNSKFGGAAQADMETTTGKLTSLINRLDDFTGKVGAVLDSALTPMLDIFSSLPEGMQNTIVAIGVLGTALAPIIIAFGAVVTAVTPLIGLIGGTAGLTAMFAGLVPLLGPAAIAIGAVVLAFKYWDTIGPIVKAVYDAIYKWLVDRFTTLVNNIMAPIRAVEAGFKWLYDKVVGQSYVPDMINGIASEFGRLDAIMVQPAHAAADRVTEAFSGMVEGVATQFEMLVTDPNLAAFFGGNPAAVGFYGGGHGGFTPEEAAAMGAGQFINFAGSGLATGRTFGAPVTINIHQPLGTPDAIARAVGDAMTTRSRAVGARL